MSGWQLAALILAAWFSFCACLACGWMALVTLARRTAPRRPGYIRLSPYAYACASPTTALTRTQLATCTASRTPTVATHGQGAYPGRLKIGSPGSSGFGTASSPGDLTTDAEGGLILGTWDATYPPWP